MSASDFKHMLAADLAKLPEDYLEQLSYPKLLSPKIDGFRVAVVNGATLTRTFQRVKNRHIDRLLSRPGLTFLDGELACGPATAPDLLNRTQSEAKRFEGEPEFTFHVFDHFGDSVMPYEDRYLRAKQVVERMSGTLPIVLVPQHVVRSAREVRAHEEQYLREGYEGIMLRDPYGAYKFGRSSKTDDDLWKLKRFIDGEAVVVRLEEAEENTNEAVRDAGGRLKRSSAKAGKVAKGMVGTIIVRDPQWGELRLQPGVMSHAQREMWWQDYATFGRGGLVGKTVHWRAFGYGVKEKPRYARFYGVVE